MNDAETSRDPTAWIRFHNYERGWRDGATGRMIARYESTTPVDVREPYAEGYAAGRKERLAMHKEAAKKYGYTPRFFREANT